MTITPNEMLCPNRLIAVRYCEISSLRDMDNQEIRDIRQEEEELAMVKTGLIAAGVGTFILIQIIEPLCDIQTSLIHSLFYMQLHIPIFKNVKRTCVLIISAIAIGILLLAIVFREPSFSQGSIFLRNKRIVRLRSKINTIEQMKRRFRGMQERELVRLKAHFERILQKYT